MIESVCSWMEGRFGRKHRRGSLDPARHRPLSSAERARIPSEDLVNRAFDNSPSDVCRTRRILVLLSTQRSGSTFICDLLWRRQICVMHEYFQTEIYLPLLAERWACVSDGQVDWSAYVNALQQYRSGPAGVLGINLHGAHLRAYLQAQDQFPAVDCCHVWLRRRDILQQAVSLAIAEQTGRWSSHYVAGRPAAYDYGFFLGRLRYLHAQEDRIAAYLRSRQIPYETVYYEDLMVAPEATLARAFDLDLNAEEPVAESAMRRQRSAESEEFLARFAADLVIHRGG